MKKRVLQIGLEFIFGPIQKYKEDEHGNAITGIDAIDKNKDIQTLDREIGELWCSLWSKDENEPSGLRFDKEKEKAIAPELLEKINSLVEKINEVKDDSFEIQDMITDYLKSRI